MYNSNIKLMKNITCKKCGNIDCFTPIDSDGYSTCIYCGSMPPREGNIEEPPNYKELYGYMFDDDYIDI